MVGGSRRGRAMTAALHSGRSCAADTERGRRGHRAPAAEAK